MKVKKYWILAVVILISGVVVCWARGEYDRKTLKGIKGFDVIVEGLSSDAKEAGLTRERLQTLVELKLRMAGIKVLTLNDKEFFIEKDITAEVFDRIKEFEKSYNNIKIDCSDQVFILIPYCPHPIVINGRSCIFNPPIPKVPMTAKGYAVDVPAATLQVLVALAFTFAMKLTCCTCNKN